jgi:hypothetical protein
VASGCRLAGTVARAALPQGGLECVFTAVLPVAWQVGGNSNTCIAQHIAHGKAAGRLGWHVGHSLRRRGVLLWLLEGQRRVACAGMLTAC